MTDKILIRGARVHNLKNLNADIPLHKIVGIAGHCGGSVCWIGSRMPPTA